MPDIHLHDWNFTGGVHWYCHECHESMDGTLASTQVAVRDFIELKRRR